jgi:hypothetical protein
MSAILAKINGLLARAAHAATPEEEARSSAHIAARLMAQHGVKLTLGADGEVRAVAEAEARARGAEARAKSAEASQRAAEARADAADARARAAEARASEAPKSEAPKSERRTRGGRKASGSAKPPKSSNPRAGEAPASERRGPACEGSHSGYASCSGSACNGASEPTGAPKSGPHGRRAYAKRIVIPARYRGFCAECDGAYEIGEPISWRKGGKTYHEKCAPQHQDAAA